MWATVVAASLFSHAYTAVANDVVCGEGETFQTVEVGAGESFSYRTQEGEEYGGRVKCTVVYKKVPTCGELSFSCETFAVHNKKSFCKESQDKMVIETDVSQKFCRTNSPDIRTTGEYMRVFFGSNKNMHDTGAVCTATCSAEASPLAGSCVLEEDPEMVNVLSTEIEGTWVLYDELNQILGGRELNETLTFTRKDSILDVWPNSEQCAFFAEEGSKIYTAGEYQYGDESALFMLTSYRGIPLLCEPHLGCFHMMFAEAADKQNDLLFLGGGGGRRDTHIAMKRLTEEEIDTTTTTAAPATYVET